VRIRPWSWLLAIALMAALAIGGFVRWTGESMHAPGPNAASLRTTVKPGATVRAVLVQLAEQGALRDARAVQLWLRAHARTVNLKAGQYEIPAHATPSQILDQIESGRVRLSALTIVEGWTFAQMRRAIERQPDLAQTLAGKPDAEVMAVLGHRDEFPEGRFFPDTYRFAAGGSDREIYELAYRRMSEVLAQAWQGRAQHLPLRSPYEALILASIIEKETGRADERARIAGVFIQRLRTGMRLQTDPAVIYGIGARYDGNIRERDLRTDTPYNTYLRWGLPPTPIALPGRDAIWAAVRPEVTGAVFFVATGQGDGSHYFSKTLTEHNAAIQRLLLRQRAEAAP
jgi:UPF0755 protein